MAVLYRDAKSLLDLADCGVTGLARQFVPVRYYRTPQDHRIVLVAPLWSAVFRFFVGFFGIPF